MYTNFFSSSTLISMPTPAANILVDTNINSDIIMAEQMEVKSQQLMGATVISSGDRFLVSTVLYISQV